MRVVEVEYKKALFGDANKMASRCKKLAAHEDRRFKAQANAERRKKIEAALIREEMLGITL